MPRTKDGLLRSLNDSYLGDTSVQVLLCSDTDFTEESGIAAVLRREVVSQSYVRAPAAFNEIVWSAGSARAETNEVTVSFTTLPNETYTFDSIVILINSTTRSSIVVSAISGQRLVLPSGHGLSVNDKVVFTMDTGSPPSIPMEQVVYVTLVSGNEIQVAPTLGGSPYNPGSYTGTLRLRYANGSFDSYEVLSTPETILSSGQYNVPIRMFMKNGIS